MVSWKPGEKLTRAGMRPAVLGIVSGAFFALSAIGFRGGIQALPEGEFESGMTLDGVAGHKGEVTLRLKAKEDRRLRAGHLWVFSNELEADEKFKTLIPGSLCRLEDSRGKPLGTGYVNPRTLLAVRLLTGDGDAKIDVDWLIRRIEMAARLREVLYPTPHYRLIHAESDGLPGLVVDRYGDVLCAQFTTAGMENLKPLVIEALQAVLQPRGIFIRNDSGAMLC